MSGPVLRFGTVVSVAGRVAQVRFPGSPAGHPVRCVESVPAVGAKVAVWSSFDRLYYLGSGAGGQLTVSGAQPGQNTDIHIRRAAAMSGRLMFDNPTGAPEAGVTVNVDGMKIRRFNTAGQDTAWVFFYTGDSAGGGPGTTDVGIRAKVLYLYTVRAELLNATAPTDPPRTVADRAYADRALALVKQAAAAATDFNDFKTRIANL